MKTKLSLLILTAILLLMPSCIKMVKGDGQVTEMDVQVTDFDELSVACPFGEIRYVQSDAAPALSVTTDKNVYDKLEIKQEGQEITIKLKEPYKDKIFFPSKFIVTANSKTLKEFQLAGKATFNLDSPLTSERLKISVAGAGTINLNDSVNIETLKISLAGSSTVNAPKLCISELSADIAGSGTYNLGGTAQKSSFSIAGKGKVKALDLKTAEVSCNVAGYASLAFYATDKIKAQIAGYSRLKYKGNPQITQEGFASVSKVD